MTNFDRLGSRETGSAIIAAVLALGLITALCLSVFQYQIDRAKKDRADRIKPSINAFKGQLLALISSPKAWTRTQEGNAQTFAQVQAARPRSDNVSDGVEDRRHRLIDIFSENSSSAFYQSTNSTVGFDLNGNVCSVEKTPRACPFRYEISLESRTLENGRWKELVRFKLILNATSELPPINPENSDYSFIYNRAIVSEAAVESLCSSTGGSYQSTTGSCSTRLTQEADCMNPLVFVGPHQNQSEGVCGSHAPTSNCQSGQSVFGISENGDLLCRIVPGST